MLTHMHTTANNKLPVAHWKITSREHTKLPHLSSSLQPLLFCLHLFALRVRESVLLHMPDSLPAWAAFLERQEDRAGPSLVKRTALH
jgi:hypothetical protein